MPFKTRSGESLGVVLRASERSGLLWPRAPKCSKTAPGGQIRQTFRTVSNHQTQLLFRAASGRKPECLSKRVPVSRLAWFCEPRSGAASCGREHRSAAKPRQAAKSDGPSEPYQPSNPNPVQSRVRPQTRMPFKTRSGESPGVVLRASERSGLLWPRAPKRSKTAPGGHRNAFSKAFKSGGHSVARGPPNRACHCLRSDRECFEVIVSTCVFDPMTAVSCRAKGRSLPRVSSLCRPHNTLISQDNGGGAGHCPRVHNAYSTYRLSP